MNETENQLEKSLNSVMSAMKSDFGLSYSKQFPGEEEVRLFKQRLYAKTKDLEPEDIIAGYESYVDSRKTFCPTLPELLTCIVNTRRDRLKSEKEQKYAMNLVGIEHKPEPTAKPEKVMEMLRVAMDKPKNSNEERIEKLNQAILEHDCLITAHTGQGLVKKIKLSTETHGCSVPFCKKIGLLSHHAGGNYYCEDHFENE
jgi:hypothetical protein